MLATPLRTPPITRNEREAGGVAGNAELLPGGYRDRNPCDLPLLMLLFLIRSARHSSRGTGYIQKILKFNRLG